MQLGCLTWTPHSHRLWRPLAALVVPILLATGTLLTALGMSTTSVAGAARVKTAGTVWLCRPGLAHDPCTASLRSTVVPAHGPRTVQAAAPDTRSAFDCFYVYPTVSTERQANANLTIQPAEVAAAVAQASRFSQVCQVWAPMYRQRTAGSLAAGLGADPQADDVAYASVLSAWRDFLAHDDHGRPIVFLGHSQGAAMLIRLLRSQVDPDPALRARTVMAILAGGNVTVPTGKSVGATFHHLSLCSGTIRSGCVIAYSSFPSKPPVNANFGRPGRGVSLQSDQRAKTGLQVACVNPASLRGGTADLEPYFLTATSKPPPPPVTTPWVTYPDLYRASCRSGGGATWLQVTTLDPGGRPTVSETLGPTWGYHLDDINLSLGNLVQDVAVAESMYQSHR